MTRLPIGRDAELGAVAEMLAAVTTGPASLALFGEAGIGKTSVWEAGVGAARDRGFAVLACRPAASELPLAYVGLADLFGSVKPEVVAGLPRPQRRAIDAALLRSADDDQAPDHRALATGFLSILDGMSAVAPVLVAVDDLQWLDDPTVRVVEFAARRCRGPIAMLTAERRSEDDQPARGLVPLDPTRFRRLRIPPLTLGALHHVLRSDTGVSFPRPVMLRIAELSGGNPFFALELARSFLSQGSSPAVFSRTLSDLLRARLDALAEPAGEALFVASALASPRLGLVARACGTDDVVGLLAHAEDGGVVDLADGIVRFTHPLLARAVYAAAGPAARRALHRRLSPLVDDVEERGRHLALAATGYDAETVRALDAAAAHARRRGAVSAAAELAELAIGLGADDVERLVTAARDHFHADDPARARELLERAAAGLGPGRQRAAVLSLLGAVVWVTEDFGRAVDLLERALDEAAGDPGLRASIAVELCIAAPNFGRIDDAVTFGKLAVEQAREAGDGGLLAEALGLLAVVRFVNGQGVDEGLLHEALRLEDADRGSHALAWPSLNSALIHLWTHQLDRARPELAALERRCVERGLESDLWFISVYAMFAALWTGDIAAAERLVADLTERAGMAGSEPVAAAALAARATVAAWTGRVEEARSAVRQALEGMANSRFAGGSFVALGAVGIAELSVGDYATAAEWLAPAAEQTAAAGLGEPVVVPFLPDAVEALVALGRLDEARPVVERLEASGAEHGRAWAEAVGARCRGLLLAADGHLDESLAAFERALAAHQRLPLPADEARTLLAVGRLHRRRNERRASKESLERAAHLFDQVGAQQWAATARAELATVGLSTGPPDELTPTEARVAQLTAAGMTNRQVAAELLVSPKTVEANLSRVYRKLGIHSRAELGRHMALQTSSADSPKR